jgi:hypothetical protein
MAQLYWPSWAAVGDARPAVLGLAAGAVVGWCACLCSRGHGKESQSVSADDANGTDEYAAAAATPHSRRDDANGASSQPFKASPATRVPPKLTVTPLDAGAAFNVEQGKVWEGMVCTAASAERASRAGSVHLPRAVRRRVLCADALDFLGSCGDGGLGGHVLTSLPCRDELSNEGLSQQEYRDWFTSTSLKVLTSTPKDNFAIFYQSDEVTDGGEWLSKFAWVHAAAEQIGARLVWHKIVCIKAPDVAKPNRRPGYSWMACWSRTLDGADNASQPDVLSHRGDMLWPKAMGRDASTLACRFIRKRMTRAAREDETSLTVVDPFAGLGTALATANLAGMHSFGIERSLKRCISAARESL